VEANPKLPRPPRLPQRAAIYISPDGRVHFGALFADLVPVARALGAQIDDKPAADEKRCSAPF
jgi:hypothetical protein